MQSNSRRTFVLDTSVLLSDPRALVRFDEHDVVVPVVVVTELEAKRSHPELGYFARQALRLMDELRMKHGRLDEPLPVGESGGTVRVELNHTDVESLPSGLRLGGQRHANFGGRAKFGQRRCGCRACQQGLADAR